ncbi:MAG: glycosyltransferase [Flavobacteriales bacterium]|nr:glycosyltransferase [Flavobacteriales bacterium]MCW8912404.1 glycosyltransferase [Flavobacteriales bacterium]MCW8936488.1 glycosyltransferase [Flavobacteriales bacterium]MCW8939950.1 glycosyltransferase [Flavobacteriales bacterium]MCW8969192.1 glycosyltransferase [Flavobacteriales bacterium]
MSRLVSIIIPCYNAEKYIAETIQSVINQTYKNWELIVVNDGSTDNSLDIIKEFVANDNRIACIDKPNSGVSDSRNKGLEKSKGDFIAFLDADDIWKLEYLEKQITNLQANQYTISYTACQLINQNGEKLNHQIRGENNPQLDDFLIQKANYNTNPSGIVYKKKCFENVIGFDINLSNNADQDILIQMLAEGNTIGYIDELLWEYRIHGNNMSKNIGVLEKDTLYLFNKCANQKLFTNFWFERKCFSIMYLMLAGSWWKNGNNKLRGLYFIWLSVINYPPQLFNVLKKMF